MKKFIKTLIAATLLLSTLIALCVPSAAASFSDVAETHWAYENINKISDTGLMIGRGTPGGIVFDPKGYITGFEMYETLYRIAEGKYSDNCLSETFTMNEQYQNKWYSDSHEWAAKNGVAEVAYIFKLDIPANTTTTATYDYVNVYARYGNPTSFDDLNDHDVPEEMHGTFSSTYTECNATRTDVVLSLYFYMTTYLGIEVTESADLSIFSDWNYNDFKQKDPYITTVSLPKSHRIVHNVYYKEFVSAWEWAVGSGIIKGCGDGTLSHIKSADGQFRYITRAEYATILDRFTTYLETVK